jgi:hypothetical protein
VRIVVGSCCSMTPWAHRLGVMIVMCGLRRVAGARRELPGSTFDPCRAVPGAIPPAALAAEGLAGAGVVAQGFGRSRTVKGHAVQLSQALRLHVLESEGYLGADGNDRAVYGESGRVG